MKVLLVTRQWSRTPKFGGATWVPMQFVIGLRRLGIDVLWVDHLSLGEPDGQPVEQLVQEFGRNAELFGFGDRWCIVHAQSGRFFGRAEQSVYAFVRDARLLLGMSSMGLPGPLPLRDVPRRAYLDVDPVFTQIWAQQVDMGLSDYNVFFTVGQNVGRPEWRAPTLGIEWMTYLPPVVRALWPVCEAPVQHAFTTIGDFWGHQFVDYEGEQYYGKREEFLKFKGAPLAANQPVDVALTVNPIDAPDLDEMRRLGWRILDPEAHAGSPTAYRAFIQGSGAEFSVAKSGYVRSNSGWISDRTVCYLASGRPAVVQSTGLEHALPTGKGLVTFRTPQEAVAAITSVRENYEEHRRAAAALAERFDSDVVLPDLLRRAGVLTRISQQDEQPDRRLRA